LGVPPPNRANKLICSRSKQTLELRKSATHKKAASRSVSGISAGLTTTTHGAIVMATNSLPQPILDTFKPIIASAVAILARLAARNAVKEQLRSEGVRVSLVRPCEINIKVTAYLALHPELFDEAPPQFSMMKVFRLLQRGRHDAADDVRRARPVYWQTTILTVRLVFRPPLIRRS